MGFDPTTTEFRSNALTDWATRPWVQLARRANFVQLLQFHLFVQFISVFVVVNATFALGEAMNEWILHFHVTFFMLIFHLSNEKITWKM